MILKHLIIIGVGGFAREIYWHSQDSIGYGIDWDLKGFLDGDVKLSEQEYKKIKLPVLGDINSYKVEQDDVFICAIADPKIKKKLINIILQHGGKFINLIHKTAIVHGNVNMGLGNILSPHVLIHDHVIIGNYVTFNVNSMMGHDSSIDNYSSIMGNVIINGYAKIGENVYMATSSIALPHSKIEDDAFVGVSSVVFKRVRKGNRVFGNSAFPI